MTPPPDQAVSIILCADDYGMNEGVTGAILDLAAAGRISATSCMTGAPGWPAAARRLPTDRAQIGIGLHLTLTWGAPLGPMPDFAPGGRMPKLGSVILRAVSGRLPTVEIRAEIERQLDAFIAAMGRPPDFIDGHQHVHTLPGVRNCLLAVLSDRRLADSVWLRDPSDSLSSILVRRLSWPKALLVDALSLGFARQARGAGFKTNRGFSGFSPFDPGRDPGADMARYLARPGPAPLVMCHPGHADPDDVEDEIADARVGEFAYLASPAFGALLENRNITLVPSPMG